VIIETSTNRNNEEHKVTNRNNEEHKVTTTYSVIFIGLTIVFMTTSIATSAIIIILSWKLYNHKRINGDYKFSYSYVLLVHGFVKRIFYIHPIPYNYLKDCNFL